MSEGKSTYAASGARAAIARARAGAGVAVAVGVKSVLFEKAAKASLHSRGNACGLTRETFWRRVCERKF